MQNELEVRLVETAEPDLVALINRAYRSPPGAGTSWTGEGHLVVGDRITLAGLERELNQERGRPLAAYEGSRLVGTITAWPGESPEEVVLGMLAVDPECQARGVGSALMAAAERRAAAEGRTRAVLWLFPKRAELLAYYERRGYALVPGERMAFPAGRGFGEPRPETVREYGGDVHFVKMTKLL